ncbi:MAG: S-adenosylmethionine:tRNA ribosyltransferase-isomerase, partial [Myxococcota bacterium]
MNAALPPVAKAAPALRAGTDPRRPWHATRLLVAGRRGGVRHARVDALPELLGEGDLLVLNDSATLPASLRGTLRGAPIELRLAGAEGPGAFPARWTGVLFGAGDWRDDTEDRPSPPPVRVGDRLRFGTLEARVAEVLAPLRVRFDRSGDALAEALYAHARPVQYRHLLAPLALGDVQTPYAARPWSVEMPSTGRPLAWPLLRELEARGVG